MNKTDLYRNIVEQSPDAILFADTEGVIHIWNKGACRIFGFSAEEAVGQSLDLIIPEKMRNRHWDGYHRVLENGQSRYATELLSVPALHKSGKQISCEFSIIMHRDHKGKVTGFSSIMRDVTSRWEREQELKKKLATIQNEIR